MLAVIGRALSERGIQQRDPPLPFSAQTQLPPDKEAKAPVKKVEAAQDKAPTEDKAPAEEERWTGVYAMRIGILAVCCL